MSSHVEEEHALKITHGDQFGGRSRGMRRQSYNKTTVECYNCHKLGHFQWECPIKENKTNYVETEEEMFLMAYMDMNKADREDMWFLNSGCSNRMCGKKEYFSDFDKSFRDLVKLGNNSSMVGLKTLQQKKMVNGLPQLKSPLRLCKDCLVGKQQRYSFQGRALGELHKFFN
ncbi:hypothetical protein AAG906_016282 [Vitis piasezkii]